MTIELRDATAADAANLLAVRHRMFGETDFMLYASEEYTATTEMVADSISRFQSARDSRLILALDDDLLIGYLSVTGTEVPRRRHTANVVLGVLRSHWGRGVGAQLLGEAIAWARTTGIARLELGVMTDNERAVRLYEKVGFRVEGTRKRAYVIKGRSVDEHVMAFVSQA